MTKFIGRRASLGIGKETTRGVGVPADFWLNCLSFNHNDKVAKARTDGTIGGIWGGEAALVAQKWGEGDLEVELGDKSFGLILLATLGTVSSAVEETTAYKHTYSLQNDNVHDSLSMYLDDPDRDLLFELSMVKNIVITIVPEEIVKYTIGFMSKSSVPSSSTPSYSAENKFLGRNLTFKVAANTGALGAATQTKLKSLTITIEKNTEIYNALGSVQPEDINNKKFNITGELELLYESDTVRDLMLNGTYQAMRIDLVNKDKTIGATSNPSFRLDLSKVDFEGWEADYSLDDLVLQTLSFTGLFDVGGNDNIINDCYLINEQASY